MDEIAYKVHCKEDLQWVCKVCINTRKDNNEIYALVSEMMKMERVKNDREKAQLLEMMRKMSDQITGLEKKIENKVNEKLKGIEKDILNKVTEEVNQKLETFKRR